MTDTEIIDLFFARSEQAIAALSQQYGRLLRHTADNILGSPEDAEECVNDSYLAVWNTVPPKRPDPLPAYCLRIVRNLSLSLLRRRGAQKRDSAYDCALDELSETLAGPESVEDAVENLNEIIEGVHLRFQPEGSKDEKLTSRALKDMCVFEAHDLIKTKYKTIDGKRKAYQERTPLSTYGIATAEEDQPEP